MKKFDDIVAMTDDEKMKYLKEEEERIISNADPKNVLKLRKLQAECERVRRTVKDPLVRQAKLSSKMWESVYDFRDILNSTVTGDKK